MNIRNTATARQDDAIQNNVAKIETAKKANALEVMAQRLNVSPNGLKTTLMDTVFKKATDSEFVALMIVANAYGLNPLTKEIYAFPAKGGGIVPVVSIDGWIRIANEHPMMDGFEQEFIADDDGKLMACETTIYRKDRTRPVRLRAYLDECKGNTEPWNKMPARMLGHKSFIQCARYAFGFSGIYSEDDVLVGDITLGGDMVTPMRNTTRMIEERAEPVKEVAHDADTGEISDTDDRDQSGFTLSEMERKADMLIGRFKKAEIVADYNAIAKDFDLIAADMDGDVEAAVQRAADDAHARLTA
jgi:phage recombination protein Bet